MTAYLWGEIIWGTAQRPDGRVAVFCEAEIGDLDVTVEVEKDVLRLQITIDDIFCVEVVEGERDLGRVELRHGVRETLRYASAPESTRGWMGGDSRSIAAGA